MVAEIDFFLVGHLSWPKATPPDVLELLKWTMRAIDVYFCAINVKGRRWIPAPEALDLCQHCHNICDPGRNVEKWCCLEDVGLEDVGLCQSLCNLAARPVC